MVKKQPVSGDRYNTKDWSYQSHIITEAARLDASFTRLLGESVVPPRFASEMKIRASGMNQPIIVPIRVNLDIENCLRAMHNVKYRQKRKGIWVELRIPFELVTIQPTPPAGTPNAGHPVQRTATVR